MADNSIINILKIRDDNVPFRFRQQERDAKFEVVGDKQFPSWISAANRSFITKSDLRHGIEPWLTSLFQSEHLSLL